MKVISDQGEITQILIEHKGMCLKFARTLVPTWEEIREDKKPKTAYIQFRDIGEMDALIEMLIESEKQIERGGMWERRGDEEIRRRAERVRRLYDPQ